MTRVYNNLVSRSAPQSQPASLAQVPNSAGGYSFVVDDFDRLDRFLILGSEGGTYYVGERKLSLDNARTVVKLVQKDGLRVVSRIVEVSESGRAPKNDPAIFALALAAHYGDEATKRAAYATLPRVARTPTHLFMFLALRKSNGLGGWSRGLRRAVSAWYNEKPVDKLAYQIIKYRNREGYTHKDVLRLAHPIPLSAEHNALYHWITKNEGRPHELIEAFEMLQAESNPEAAAYLIASHGLPHEAVPTELKTQPIVWEALLQNMPMTALIRNLATMTKIGLLATGSAATKRVAAQLVNAEALQKARVHPIAILTAMKTYQGGHGVRGSASWEPVRAIIDALDDAFYTSFGFVDPTDKRIAISLDVSGSMSWTVSGLDNVSCCEASTAMAMVTARAEKDYHIFAFNRGLTEIPISPRQRLTDAMKYTNSINGGGTDCALPMVEALERKIPVDAFFVYTDNETWAGSIHPHVALTKYRDKMGIPAKLIVVGMASTGFTIADPNDAGSMDVVGFDTAAPNVMSGFVRRDLKKE